MPEITGRDSSAEGRPIGMALRPHRPIHTLARAVFAAPHNRAGDRPAHGGVASITAAVVAARRQWLKRPRRLYNRAYLGRHSARQKNLRILVRLHGCQGETSPTAA